VNLLSYVGLGQVRELVMGNDERAPKTAELEQMSRLVADAMKQGAYGVSTGLIYSPNAYAKTDELIALSRPASAAGGLYASHLRYDGEKLREGLEEAIAIGEGARIPVHVFHLKVTGAKNFGRMKEVIALVDAARKRGVEFSADQYPYVRQQHRPVADDSAVGARRRRRENGGAAEGSGDARADPPGDG